MQNTLGTAIILFCISATILQGQNINGFVRDSNGVAVPYASVVATSCTDELVLSFTSTDENGAYTLSFKTDCDSIVLTARSLGYKSASHKISLRPTPQTLDFALAATVLQEVLIRGKTPPVIGRKDTTEFNVASFSDSTEFSVEDLLKKLPGVRVSEDGRISYNGKLVERVMIEGDDLFSQNYQIATRNIRADMISKVQVIDRYEENPVLKNLRQSDRMVMNLKIKPERKRSLSGSITGGLGYGEALKSKGHTNLFSLSRKDKAYLIGSANNTGQIGNTGMDFGDRFDPDRASIQKNPLQTNGLIQSPQMNGVGLPRAYTAGNKSGLLFLGEVLPITPNTKIKLTAFLGHDRVRQESSSATRILLQPDMLDISEQKALAQKWTSRNIQTEIDFFSPNKKQSIRAFMKINDKPSGSNLQILRNQTGSEASKVASLTDENAQEAFFSAEYTFKTSANTAFQLAGKSAWSSGNYLLQPQYNWYPAFFGLDSAFINLTQNARQRQNKNVFLGRILANRRAFQGQLEAGIETYNGQIESQISLKNALGNTSTLDDALYINDLHLNAPNYFANLGLSRQIGALKVQVRLNQRYQPQRISAPSIPTSTLRQWSTEPTLGLRYEFNEKTSLGSSYKFRQENANMKTLLPAYIFTDYQSIQRGLPSLEFMPGHNAGLNFNFNDRPKQFSYYISSGFQNSGKQFGGQYQIDPYFSIQERFRPVQTMSFSINANSSKYLKNISCRVELGAGMLSMRETARINSAESLHLNTRIQSLNFSFGTAFDTWVNVILGGQGSFTTLSNTVSPTTVQTSNLLSTLQIKVRPSKKFDLKLMLHHAANRVDKNAGYRHYFAADGVAYLRLPKWRSSVDIEAFNLLGSRQFGQVTADAFIWNEATVMAVRPFFVLSWDFSF